MLRETVFFFVFFFSSLYGGIHFYTALDKMFVCFLLLFFQSKRIDIFLISPQKHVVGTHQKCLGEALLLSTHNICFHEEILKIFT